MCYLWKHGLQLRWTHWELEKQDEGAKGPSKQEMEIAKIEKLLSSTDAEPRDWTSNWKYLEGYEDEVIGIHPTQRMNSCHLDKV